mmetsp:Transcript_26698/g.76936  ORF Transcript_26698/g.76936 Transcript_26698/m.76936 type:complete len:235 (-) Transcript_26698:275-979(-)
MLARGGRAMASPHGQGAASLAGHSRQQARPASVLPSPGPPRGSRWSNCRVEVRGNCPNARLPVGPSVSVVPGPLLGFRAWRLIRSEDELVVHALSQAGHGAEQGLWTLPLCALARGTRKPLSLKWYRCLLRCGAGVAHGLPNDGVRLRSPQLVQVRNRGLCSDVGRLPKPLLAPGAQPEGGRTLVEHHLLAEDARVLGPADGDPWRDSQSVLVPREPDLRALRRLRLHRLRVEP